MDVAVDQPRNEPGAAGVDDPRVAGDLTLTHTTGAEDPVAPDHRHRVRHGRAAGAVPQHGVHDCGRWIHRADRNRVSGRRGTSPCSDRSDRTDEERPIAHSDLPARGAHPGGRADHKTGVYVAGTTRAQFGFRQMLCKDYTRRAAETMPKDILRGLNGRLSLVRDPAHSYLSRHSLPVAPGFRNPKRP